jgi:hypothetical protein
MVYNSSSDFSGFNRIVKATTGPSPIRALHAPSEFSKLSGPADYLKLQPQRTEPLADRRRPALP